MNQETLKSLAIVLDAAEQMINVKRLCGRDEEYQAQVQAAVKHLTAIWSKEVKSAPTKFKGGYVDQWGNDIWVVDKG